MKRSIRVWIWLFLLLLLIIDPQTIQSGVREGIELCLWTLIPTLFPFMILTTLLAQEMQNFYVPGISRIEHLLQIPQKYFSLFLLGLLGGYPVGAKCICDCVRDNRLPADDGKRMLCFCSNAGPSFIFGLGMSLFGSLRMCLQIWICQIISALLLAMFIPATHSNALKDFQTKPITVSQALKEAIVSMAMVCGWVILFRVFLCFTNKWILNQISDVASIVVYGILEIANGCISLQNIKSDMARFVLFSMFLGFGGLCVCMQTQCLAENAGVDSSWYLPAKVLQGLLAGILALASYYFGWMILPIFFIFLLLIQYTLQKITTGIFSSYDV